ncbi:MAG: zinc ribbon domain-containing protein [Chloroflexi bacterium]|nr:zinc ribbon domain-containing protein [Chloroflexota bacterium]
MAIYEYYCPTCRERFEQRRPMSEAGAAVQCPQGHRAERTVSVFAAPRGGTAIAEAPMGGGCCGGGACGCSN